MIPLADVMRRHAAGYLARYSERVLPSHVRAMRAIVSCRTPALGGQLAQCTQCGKEHLFFHSCRHRACPRCGFDAASRWLTRQRELLLPVPYFHVVFTLPAELRRIVRSHQHVLIDALFRAAFESLAALCRDPHFLGGQIGALAVLHTWTRTLEWHPHIHMLVPGGALADDGRTWLRPPRHRKAFLVPVQALSKLFRGRFLHLARQALSEQPLPHIPWSKRWVVFAKPVVHGAERVLEYLGRYVHRTALSDKAIVEADDRHVTFAYRDSRHHQRRAMSLPPHEFLRRFLQHVPRHGMHRVRSFGLLNPAHRTTLRQLQLLLGRPSPPEASESASTKPAKRCPHCHHPALRTVRRLSALECLQRAAVQGTATARAPPHQPVATLTQGHLQ